MILLHGLAHRLHIPLLCLVEIPFLGASFYTSRKISPWYYPIQAASTSLAEYPSVLI